MIAHATDVVKATSVDHLGTPPLTLNALAADYAAKHGITLSDLTCWQWKPVIWENRDQTVRRPALKFITNGQKRWRFLDNQEPRYTSQFGYKRCWYGLTPELIASIDDETPLVICNGEISTVTGQTYLVPAICMTSGEKGRIPQSLLDELTAALPGASILIALDCDPAGRKAAAGMLAQLVEAGFKARAVDMALSIDGGDLADFCMMHGAAAYERLLECPDLPQIEQPHAHGITPCKWQPHVSRETHVSGDLSPAAEAKREAWFKKAWDGIVRTVETTTSGRYSMVWWGACKLLDLVQEGYRSESEARTAIENACEINGYRADHGQRAVMAQWQGAVKATRESVDMPDFSASRRAEKYGESTVKVRQEVRQKYVKSTSKVRGDSTDSKVPQKTAKSTPENAANSASLEQVSQGLVTPYIAHYTPLPILEASDGRPEQLPDALIMRGLDVWGSPVMSELSYLLGAQSRGQLAPIFTLEDVNQARAAEGIDSPAPVHVYPDLVKYGALHKVKNELIDGLHPIESINKKGCILSINSKRGRKHAAYELPSLADIKRAMFQPMALSLMAMHPDKKPLIDTSLVPLMRAVLEGLLMWKKPYQSLTVNMVGSILKNAEYLAEDVYKAILDLPITDVALLSDMGWSAAEAATYAAIASTQGDTFAGLIALKNRLMLRLYQTHLDALDNPHTTPLLTSKPRVGKAWLNAFYNALIKPHNGGYLWAYELNGLMGMPDKKDKKRAKSAAQRAGICSTPRDDTRVFTVAIQGDSTPTWGAVKRAAKEAAKQGEAGRALHIRSYDERGHLVGSADVSEADPDHFNIGVRYEVVVQLRNLITVSDAALLADLTSESVAPAAAQSEKPSVDKQKVTKESPKSHRRITPARLYDRKWLLERLLAPFCKTDSGLWFNPLTGELHESAEAVLTDAMALVSQEHAS